MQSVTFAEFLERLKPKPQKPEPVMNRTRVQLQVKQAEDVLQKFKPPERAEDHAPTFGSSAAIGRHLASGGSPSGKEG